MSAVSSLTWPDLGDPGPLLAGRFRVLEVVCRRGGVERFLARDESAAGGGCVQLVREELAADGEPPAGDGSVWPSLAWEERLRSRCRHHGLPRVLGRFSDDGFAYLALEIPAGVSLWDAWDDPASPTADKFGWLIQLADLLQVVHSVGAILEGLRPDQVVLTPSGQVVLVDTGNLLPLPLPADAPIAVTCSTPPELSTGVWIDARSDLYCFGALVYALELGRELTDLDFDAPGQPKPFLERFPDAHPLLGRLLSKTIQPAIDRRFPTPDGAIDDPSGFAELIALLEQCQRTLSRVRIDAAAWSTTGMVRGGNEDAFALLRATAGRQDDVEDFALVIAADGMGGNAAGEVAAALAVQSLYRTLAAQPPFDGVATADESRPLADPRLSIAEALREANRAVYIASRQGVGRRGMGCTAEVVYTDGRRLLIGHVGDSRTYRSHRGRLALLTHDQTYVNRLVELGEIEPHEAEYHPRRSELQQAIGGWTEVEPEMIEVPLEPGDWVVVCSDGLSNQLRPTTIQDVLQRCTSAESAARQLVNAANLAGAADNVTAAVIRAV
jgi:serine/threonine protein phosphatase PrpC